MLMTLRSVILLVQSGEFYRFLYNFCDSLSIAFFRINGPFMIRIVRNGFEVWLIVINLLEKLISMIMLPSVLNNCFLSMTSILIVLSLPRFLGLIQTILLVMLIVVGMMGRGIMRRVLSNKIPGMY